MLQRTVFSVFYLFLGLLISWAQDIENKTLTTSVFNGIKIYSGLHVNLISSDVNKAVVSGAQSDDVILSIKDKTLTIKLAIGSLTASEPTKIDLYHSRNLNKIQAYNKSLIKSQEKINQTSIIIESKSNALIDLQIETERLDLLASLGGRIALEGSSTALNLKVNYGGSCEVEQLKTDQINAQLIVGGYAYVTVRQLIDAVVIGGSVLRVYGDPNKRIYQKKLGGKIFFKD